MEWVASVKRDIGAFLQCGSYYPLVTYADELWDGFMLIRFTPSTISIG
jgi:hypothetical protein